MSKAVWSWGYVSAIDSDERTIWIADAHRDDGKRFAALMCSHERQLVSIISPAADHDDKISAL